MAEVNDKKILELRNLVEGADLSLQQARQIINQIAGNEEGDSLTNKARVAGNITVTQDSKIIEGIFDGQNMVGPDGKKYSVPANYASKSKLVEGDSLKLTITADGSFVYKQINQLERDRLSGTLVLDEETGDYRVLADNKSYKVLTASVTYFKGESGDNVALLVPKGRESTWAAVENIFSWQESEKQKNDTVIENLEQLENVNESEAIKQPEDVKEEEDREPIFEEGATIVDALPLSQDDQEKNSNRGEFLAPDDNSHSADNLIDNFDNINSNGSNNNQGLDDI